MQPTQKHVERVLYKIMDGQFVQEDHPDGSLSWWCTKCGKSITESATTWDTHLASVDGYRAGTAELVPATRYDFWGHHLKVCHGWPERDPVEVARNNAWVALDRQCMWLSTMQEGRRNNHLNRTAYIEGRAAIRIGWERYTVEQMLRDAATQAGLGPVETDATIRSGLGAGA